MGGFIFVPTTLAGGQCLLFLSIDVLLTVLAVRVQGAGCMALDMRVMI